MARLSIRIDLDDGVRIGPGKARLLEAIAEAGSISGAGRMLGMSYRRAWSLVSELNAIFGEPLVETSAGGARGGGAALTPLGRLVVEAYREIEAGAADRAGPLLAELSARRR